MSSKDPTPLHRKAQEVARIIDRALDEGAHIVVVSHHDADGLAAAGIMGAALIRRDANLHLRVIPELDENALDEIAEIGADLAIFADIGSGYLELLASVDLARSVIVLDHHPPSRELPADFVQLNPHDLGFHGATEISGAGVAYFAARALSHENVDLATLAVVGALGDMQDKNDDRCLRGINSFIVEDGVKSGLLSTEIDLILFGRETRPVHKALAYTTTPYLPGLSGEEDNCLSLLSSANIPIKVDDRWRTTADLSTDEKRRLLDSIINHLAAMGFRAGEALNLIGTVYTLTKEPPRSPLRDAREYAATLNACGRMDHGGLAVALCLGERNSTLREVNEITSNYRRALANYTRWLLENPNSTLEMRTITVIRGEETIAEGMAGAFSSIISSAGHLRGDKATVVLAASRDGGVKVSARAPESMLRLGVDLGAALREAAMRFEGFGGGHNVAAGAHLARTNLEHFLNVLDSIILRQMGKG